eukprot:g55795.t1
MCRLDYLRVAMSKMLTQFLCLVSLVLLAHCAVSMSQFQEYVRSTGNEGATMPFDIAVECLLTLVLSTYSIIAWAGPFKQKLAVTDLSAKSWDSAHSNKSFRVFSHRGKALGRLYQQT